MRDVLTARRNLGRFTNTDELGAYTQLTPGRIDEVRDLMIFTWAGYCYPGRGSQWSHPAQRSLSPRILREGP